LIKAFPYQALKIYLLSIIFFLPVGAGIRNKEAFRWQNINKNYLIDTKDIVVKENELKLWVQLKGYSKLSLILDCKDFTYKKEFGKIVSQIKPINNDKITYLIANQLCFLTSIDGFFMEFRRPKWARTIIKNATQKKDLLNSDAPSENERTESANPIDQKKKNQNQTINFSNKQKIPNLKREQLQIKKIPQMLYFCDQIK